MNQEQRNSLYRRAYHRLVSRALRTDATLLEESRAVVRTWRSEPRRADYVDEWDRILSGSIAEVRQTITRRSPDLDRLRTSSPFFLTPTRLLSQSDRLRLRRRISQLATAR